MCVDDENDKGAHLEEQNETKPSSGMLKCYLQHVGLARKKRRRRCLSAELSQISGMGRHIAHDQDAG